MLAIGLGLGLSIALAQITAFCPLEKHSETRRTTRRTHCLASDRLLDRARKKDGRGVA